MTVIARETGSAATSSRQARRLLVRLLGLVGALVLTWANAGLAAAADAAPIAVPSGVSYELIGRWDIDTLNRILTVDSPKYFGISVPYTPARNAVRLYRITYASVVPEQNNRPIVATGLLAVPDTGASSFPVLSYQHGSAFLKTQVPSFPDQSGETQLIVAQFAGQGYVVIGADYFGMGASTEPEAFGVMASQQQASLDMLRASKAVLAQMQIATGKLFLGGLVAGGLRHHGLPRTSREGRRQGQRRGHRQRPGRCLFALERLSGFSPPERRRLDQSPLHSLRLFLRNVLRASGPRAILLHRRILRSGAARL